MRSVFSKTVQDERVKVSDGTFDTTGVEDGWADFVVIAQVRKLTRFPASLRADNHDRLSTGAPTTNSPPKNSTVS